MAKERKLTVEEIAKRLNDRKAKLEEQYKIGIHSLSWNGWTGLIYEGYEIVTEIISPEWVVYTLNDWVWVEDI